MYESKRKIHDRLVKLNKFLDAGCDHVEVYCRLITPTVLKRITTR